MEQNGKADWEDSDGRGLIPMSIGLYPSSLLLSSVCPPWLVLGKY